VPVVLLVAVFAGILGVARATVPPYWRVEASTGPGGLSIGRTAAGHPWIGASEPVLEIEEFSDYQCPHCQRGHDAVRKLLESYPDRVRLVHRHYPLGRACNPLVRRPYHPEACRYARLAYCAQQKGRFWEANDYLYAHGRRRNPVRAEELAAAIDLDAGSLKRCAASERAAQAIQQDLESGRDLGVRGTPTFVVEGVKYPGRIPPDVIRRALSGSGGAPPATGGR
jgi:protein-disulfide isomerase